MRSRIGPDTRDAYRRRAIGGQVQRSPRPTKLPHGHGFAAVTSWNRAGNRTVAWERAMTTSPCSSGWRSASSAPGLNSGTSSRKSTPWWASEAAPGRGIREPPPTSELTVAVWCGCP